MAKKNEKNQDAAPLAAETLEQQESAGGQQLAEAADPVPDVAAAATAADELTGTGEPEAGSVQQPAGTDTPEPAGATGPVQGVINPDLSTVAADPEEDNGDELRRKLFSAAPPAVERWTVQAVAVPNNRRMRGGRVFTDEPVTVCRDDFSDEQWRAILNDTHLKAIRLDGAGNVPEPDETIQFTTGENMFRPTGKGGGLW